MKKQNWEKIKDPETSQIYLDELVDMAEADGYYPCNKCGHVVRPHCCCGTCGSENPE